MLPVSCTLLSTEQSCIKQQIPCLPVHIEDGCRRDPAITEVGAVVETAKRELVALTRRHLVASTILPPSQNCAEVRAVPSLE